MAFKLIEKDWDANVGEYRLIYMLDSVSDVVDLPASPAGSKAYAPASAKEYVSTCSGDWYEVQLPVGPCAELDTTDATATDADMAKGKTAYVNGVMVTGTLPTKDVIEPIHSYVKAGYVEGYGQCLYVGGIAQATNIVNKDALCEIVFPANALGTATATDVAAGKTFTSADGLKVEGVISEVKPGGWLQAIAENVVQVEDHIRAANTVGTEYILRKNGLLYMMIPKEVFGDATAEDVRVGKTFTSASGLKVVGTWDGN